MKHIGWWNVVRAAGSGVGQPGRCGSLGACKSTAHPFTPWPSPKGCSVQRTRLRSASERNSTSLRPA